MAPTLRPFWEMLLACVLAGMIAVAALNLAWISANINRDLLFVLILSVAVGLYAVRHFFRLAYGVAEVIIGVVAIFGTVDRAPQIADDPAMSSQLLVQLAAGLYIIVRGIDNSAQVEPFASGGPAFKELWKLIRNKK